MDSLITRKPIPLESILSEPVCYLNLVKPRFEYVEQKRTDKLLGYVYTATNTETFDQISVFVEQNKPLLEPETLVEMQSRNEKVYVEFINAMIRPYYNRDSKSIADAIRAVDVQEVAYE